MSGSESSAGPPVGTRSSVPDAPSNESGPEPSRAALRRFHLTGGDANNAAGPRGLEPVVLRPVLEARGPASEEYPLVLLDREASHEVVPLSRLLEQALTRAASAGAPLEILGRSVAVLSRSVERALAPERLDPVAAVLDRALGRLDGELDLSPAGSATLARELERLRPHLPTSGVVVPLGPATPVRLLADAVRSSRSAGRAALREEIERLLQQMSQLLLLDTDRGPQGRTPASLATRLGAAAALVDVDELARHLPSRHGSQPLGPSRRSRIERAAAALAAWLARCDNEPDLLLVSAELPEGTEAVEGCRHVRDDDGLTAVLELFDRVASSAVETVRAVRTARLEVAGAYDPAVHDEAMSRVEWRSFARGEMLLFPAVAALEDGRRLRDASLTAWSRLLRSGRPVQVLVTESLSGTDADDVAEGLAGHHPGLGHLAMAHRETFVLQSSLGRPQHLAAGLRRMAAVDGPAVALVALPRWDGGVSAWRQLVAAEAGRVAPCFRYDPDAGTSWADRFDLEGNPQPDRIWPVYTIESDGEDRPDGSHEQIFTFAHAAAADPLYRSQFRVVAERTEYDDLVEIGEWLDADDPTRLRSLPYVSIVGEDGKPAKAVMTREVAFACRDRGRGFRILQELAGLNNEHVRRAAERAREEARAEAQDERRALEAVHAGALERVRLEAAREAIDRLVAVLLDEGAAGVTSVRRAAPPPEGSVPPAPATQAQAPARTTAEEPEAAPAGTEPEVSFDEPYIDSVLCTTCNECTQLNSRMFAYNENRQAFVADPQAGTFEQLVKAAEKCPARCIHPGAPRADDATATEQLIARARPFNP